MRIVAYWESPWPRLRHLQVRHAEEAERHRCDPRGQTLFPLWWSTSASLQQQSCDCALRTDVCAADSLRWVTAPRADQCAKWRHGKTSRFWNYKTLLLTCLPPRAESKDNEKHVKTCILQGLWYSERWWLGGRGRFLRRISTRSSITGLQKASRLSNSEDLTSQLENWTAQTEPVLFMHQRLTCYMYVSAAIERLHLVALYKTCKGLNWVTK